MHSTCGCREHFLFCVSKDMRMTRLSIVEQSVKPKSSWRQYEGVLLNVDLNSIRRKQGSFTAKTANRREDYEHISFDFLGYTFQPREARGRNRKRFTNFLPAISNKAAKGNRQTIRKWWTDLTGNARWLEDLAKLIGPVVRGWLNYYGRYDRSECINVLQHVNEALAEWVRRKYKSSSTEKLLRHTGLEGSLSAIRTSCICGR